MCVHMHCLSEAVSCMQRSAMYAECVAVCLLATLLAKKTEQVNSLCNFLGPVLCFIVAA